VAQVVEALLYVQEGRGFDSRYFQPPYGSGVDTACNRNGYQESFVGGKDGRCVRFTTLTLYRLPSYLGALTSWKLPGL
jgi:hypothetical protein